MPSNYATTQVVIDNHNGTVTVVAGAAVKAWNVDAATDLGAVANTDSQGFIPAGTLNVNVGTKIRFRVENYQGRAAFTEFTTT